MQVCVCVCVCGRGVRMIIGKILYVFLRAVAHAVPTLCIGIHSWFQISCARIHVWHDLLSVPCFIVQLLLIVTQFWLTAIWNSLAAFNFCPDSHRLSCRQLLARVRSWHPGPSTHHSFGARYRPGAEQRLTRLARNWTRTNKARQDWTQVSDYICADWSDCLACCSVAFLWSGGLASWPVSMSRSILGVCGRLRHGHR